MAFSYSMRPADTGHLRLPEKPARRGRIQRLIETAERFGMLRAVRPLHDRLQASLTVLAYHRVMPTDALGAYPFDPELISATPRQFEWQMEYIRRYLKPVSLKDVIAHLDGERRLPAGAVAVTFDDGFADTYRYAFPSLKRYAIPATIFVATGYVDSGKPFWFELAAFLLYRVEPHSLRIEGDTHSYPCGPSVRERAQSLRQVQDVLKAMPNERRIAIVSDWLQRYSAQIEHGASEHSRPISWAQVQEMAASGIEFGSHTVTHPNLTQLGDAELEWELVESRRVLEQHLQATVCTLAYPIGTQSAFDARVIAASQRAGYRLGLSYISGANPLAAIDRFALRRHGIGLGTTAHYFRALTSLPAWID
ncbi:MAG TPA: polysaccharide deacetylase family protein [Steroidobacteraceae bacterium]|nr:polysaccharide deacetylase family protein [Steroidobacteraceae bacterium]